MTIAEFDLCATLGMTEMETATSRALIKCIEAKTWVMPITYDDMTSQSERRGFLHLIRSGYLKWVYRKDFFYFTQDLIDRACAKPAVRDAVAAAGMLAEEPSSRKIWRYEGPPMPDEAEDAPDPLAKPLTGEDLAKLKGREPLVDQDSVRGFFKEFRFLSNFHLAPIIYEGIAYPSTEHAFQAAKYPAAEREGCLRMTCMEAKRWGGQAKMSRELWESIKVGIMYDVVLMKFLGHLDLKDRLLRTRWQRLVELNDWGDQFWGVEVEDGKERGRNMLGRVLMAVRRTLQHDHGKMIAERP